MIGKPLIILQAEESGWKAPKPGRLRFYECVAGCGRGYWSPKGEVVGYCCRTCRRSARAWNRRSKQ